MLSPLLSHQRYVILISPIYCLVLLSMSNAPPPHPTLPPSSMLCCSHFPIILLSIAIYVKCSPTISHQYYVILIISPIIAGCNIRGLDLFFLPARTTLANWCLVGIVRLVWPVWKHRITLTPQFMATSFILGLNGWRKPGT